MKVEFKIVRPIGNELLAYTEIKERLIASKTKLIKAPVLMVDITDMSGLLAVAVIKEQNTDKEIGRSVRPLLLLIIWLET